MELEGLPGDPAMLASYVNLKLRDYYGGDNNGHSGLDEFCASEGIDAEALKQKLAQAGFEYSPEQNKFW